MTIKQSVKNTFKRVGIDYETLCKIGDDGVQWTAINWISKEQVQVHPLIFTCIGFVYETQLAYEQGKRIVNLSDFDRVRYFVLEQDSNAYNTCLD